MKLFEIELVVEQSPELKQFLEGTTPEVWETLLPHLESHYKVKDRTLSPLSLFAALGKVEQVKFLFRKKRSITEFELVQLLKSAIETEQNTFFFIILDYLYAHHSKIADEISLEALLDTALSVENTPIIDGLLSKPTLLLQIEKKPQYHKIVSQFTNKELQGLQAKIKEFKVIHPREMYDISADKVPFYFALLKNCIRRSDAAQNLYLLLSLPTLANHVHESMSEADPGELLRLALRVNISAARALMGLPKVQVQAHENKWAQQIFKEFPSMRQSVRVGNGFLYEGDETFVFLKERYGSEIEQRGGVIPVFNHFKDYVTAYCVKFPPQFRGENLPLDYEQFVKLFPNETLRKQAILAYYDHLPHATYRLLLDTSPWIAKDAEFIIVDNQHPFLAHVPLDDFKPLIALYWRLMCSIKGSLGDEIKQQFITEMGQLTRMYNWNPKMMVGEDAFPIGKDGLEDLDDHMGDKPVNYHAIPNALYEAAMKTHPKVKKRLNQPKEEVPPIVSWSMFSGEHLSLVGELGKSLTFGRWG